MRALRGACVFSDRSPEADEPLVFQCPDARCGGQQCVVTFQQFLGDKTHAVGHLLLPSERFWDLVKVRTGHLNEPSNLPVLVNFQTWNGQAFSKLNLIGLEPRWPSLAMA